ncbi:hypothetical protein RvY_17024 [Ramazzottius varieornatus]|uniref:HTH psq-type domain-containing protein n=1 Tax=Ramazzottius varieornatus TaxID=947166 RepID=A0A1D1W7U4_RAMVA|nr:hypothetical protein RvY_17024 [Ramazzottius varieornatus]
MSEGFKIKRRRKYTEERLQDAVRAVANGMSVRKASLTFCVPRGTIINYEQSPIAQQLGRKTKLDPTEEALLVDMWIGSGNNGFPMNKHNLLTFVDEMGFGKGIGTVFSEKWHRRFLRDHGKQISLRMGSNVDRKKAREWTVECAVNWINLLSCLESEGYLSDPSAVINLDESGFILGFEKEKVYAARGMKHVPS